MVEDKYCTRCGRKCTKGASYVNGKVYGPYCITQIAKRDSVRMTFDNMDD